MDQRGKLVWLAVLKVGKPPRVSVTHASKKLEEHEIRVRVARGDSQTSLADSCHILLVP